MVLVGAPRGPARKGAGRAVGRLRADVHCSPVRAGPPLLLALPLLAALCGCETPPSATGGSCSADGGVCLNFVTVDENLVAQALCLYVVGQGYAFHPDQSCSLEGTAGICSRSESGVSYSIVYSSAVYTTDSAATDCAARGGAFQPP